MKKLTLIQHLLLVTSASILLPACSSMRDKDNDHRHSSSMSQQSDRYSADDSSIATESSGTQNYSGSQNEISIPLHEEQLNVSKQTVESGQVTIRKIVTTQTVNQPVQLRKESLIIDRDSVGASSEDRAQASDVNEPAGAYAERRGNINSGASTTGKAFQEETFTIRLQEEQPVIQKNVVETGRITARKDSQMQQQNIQQQVRREDVKLDRSAGQNVEIGGNFTAGATINEPSGTERPQSIQNEPSRDQDEGVYENDSIKRNDRAPTQGLGAQDLKQGKELNQETDLPTDESQP